MATLLVITVFLPLLGSLALVLMPRTDDHRARSIALGIALVTLTLSLILLAGFHSEVKGPQFAFVGADGRYGLSWGGTRPRLRIAPISGSLWASMASASGCSCSPRC